MRPVYLKLAREHKRCPPISARPARPRAIWLWGAIAIIAGCGAPPANPDPSARQNQSSERNANTPRPAAIADGIEIPWSSLEKRLGELAGAQALEELVLDASLERELAERGWSVQDADVERERAMLRESIARDAGLDPSAAQAALERLRRQRGLGPSGYAALWKRNAALRKLVAEEVRTDPVEVDRAATIMAAPSVIARVIVLATEREAADVRGGLLGEPDDLAERMGRMASARSLDASARAGGRVGPVSVLADTVPQALRSTLAALGPGELSGVVAVDNGYALVLVESRTPGRTPTPEDRAQADRDVRARAERMGMERLARRLIEQARVTVMDESLAWSWAQRRAAP